jgi:hypothetical protein
MKKILLGLLLFTTTMSISLADYTETIHAKRNCEVALNMDQSYIDSNIETLRERFIQRGYSSNFLEIGHQDFPLTQEFTLMVGSSRVGFKIEAEASLRQAEVVGESANLVFKNWARAYSDHSALNRALSHLPFCSLW